MQSQVKPKTFGLTKMESDELSNLLTRASDYDIPANNCENCDFCKQLDRQAGTMVCDVMGFDWHIDWTPAYDKHCPEFYNSLDTVMSRSETANIWKYPENTVSWPKVKKV